VRIADVVDENPVPIQKYGRKAGGRRC